jgi:hypothetical protein
LPGQKTPGEVPNKIVHDANLSLDEEGFLIIKMKDGRVIEHGKTRRLVHMAKDIEKFYRFMQSRINEMNEDVDTLLHVHKEAVSPTLHACFTRSTFMSHTLNGCFPAGFGFWELLP